MAKKDANGMTKTAHVRENVKEHRRARNVDIATALTKEGVEVSANYVSMVRNKNRKGKKKRIKAGRKAGRVAAAPAGVGIDHIKAAATLIKGTGGIAEASAALSAAESVAKAVL